MSMRSALCSTKDIRKNSQSGSHNFWHRYRTTQNGERYSSFGPRPIPSGIYRQAQPTATRRSRYSSLPRSLSTRPSKNTKTSRSSSNLTKLWYEEIKTTLAKIGLAPSVYDPCVFHNRKRTVTLCVYVDDLLFTYLDRKDYDHIIACLESGYGPMRKQTGNTVDYLNVQITKVTIAGKHALGTLLIHQNAYIKKLLEKYQVQGMSEIPHTSTLFDIDSSSPPAVSKDRFVALVMALLYVCNRARPDIFLDISFLCTRLSKPTQEDEAKLLRVLRYLNRFADLGMALAPVDINQLHVVAYVDASYACHADAKGHTGTVVCIGDSPSGIVLAKAKKQRLVARSSTESELIGLHDSTPAVVWTQNFLQEAGFPQLPAVVYQDNKSTIHMGETGHGTYARSKHIAVRYFGVHELIELSKVVLKYKNTADMWADLFTKPLMGSQFTKLRDILMGA